ncbi:hypothetical protein HDU87_005447 [Geranomyces variabilis]|uniref:Uncharacterized protein n=1 Tax=Geranomyces variabilis TaxID=109894 RepID=A0AAD5THK6_9FUNG|nr:hypothetical protein HDU87_005447 [Geranomyces variabilis]
MFPAFATCQNSGAFGRTSPDDATSSASPDFNEEDEDSTSTALRIIMTPQKGSPSSSRPLMINAGGTHERSQRCLVEGVPLRLGRAVKARDPSSSSHPPSRPAAFGDFFIHGAGGPSSASLLGSSSSSAAAAAAHPTAPAKPTLTAAGVVLPNGTTKKTQEFVFFNSKVVSRCHAEIWTRDGQVYLRDTASSSGTFLNRMRLSPSGKESRPYPLKSGDVVQLGLDYVGDKKRDDHCCPETVIKDSYRAPVLTLTLAYPTHSAELKKRRSLVYTFRQLLGSLLTLTNPYAESFSSSAFNLHSTSASNAASDCVICLSGIGPYQALFLSPCSHMYHYKCVKGLVNQSHMFSCPLCRQIANLDASVSMDSLCDLAGGPELDDEGPGFSEQAQPDLAAAHGDMPPYSGTTPVQMDEPSSSSKDYEHEPGNGPKQMRLLPIFDHPSHWKTTLHPGHPGHAAHATAAGEWAAHARSRSLE